MQTVLQFREVVVGEVEALRRQVVLGVSGQLQSSVFLVGAVEEAEEEPLSLDPSLGEVVAVLVHQHSRGLILGLEEVVLL